MSFSVGSHERLKLYQKQQYCLYCNWRNKRICFFQRLHSGSSAVIFFAQRGTLQNLATKRTTSIVVRSYQTPTAAVGRACSTTRSQLLYISSRCTRCVWSIYYAPMYMYIYWYDVCMHAYVARRTHPPRPSNQQPGLVGVDFRYKSIFLLLIVVCSRSMLLIVTCGTSFFQPFSLWRPTERSNIISTSLREHPEA